MPVAEERPEGLHGCFGLLTMLFRLIWRPLRIGLEGVAVVLQQLLFQQPADLVRSEVVDLGSEVLVLELELVLVQGDKAGDATASGDLDIVSGRQRKDSGLTYNSSQAWNIDDRVEDGTLACEWSARSLHPT